MEDAFRRILARLPFPVRDLHPDNGSEFPNDHLRRFWQEYEPAVSLSRSRPYHKDDKRFVGERNRTLVRAFLGKDRLDSVTQTVALRRFYDRLWVYA